MPILLDNTAVITNIACQPIPTPVVNFTAPNIVGAELAPEMDAARVIPGLSVSLFDAPSVIGSVTGGAFAEARTLSSVGAAAMAAPVVISSASVANMAAPNNIGGIAAGSFAVARTLSIVTAGAFLAPALVSALSATNMASPNNIGGISSSVFAVARTLTQVSSAAMIAPRVLTPKAYSDTPPFPLSHSRILYDSLLTGSTVSTSGGTGGNALVLQPDTFNRWQFSGAQNILVTLPANQSIDCIAVAGLFDTAQSIQAFYSTATTGGFTSLSVQSCVNGGARMWFISSPVSIRRIQINITGLGAQSIATISAGLALQMQRPIYGGVNPITLNRVTDYFNNRSESGEWLGRQIRRRGLESSLSFERLTAPWYRQYFDPFVKSARERPFFFAWRPSEFPLECAYCWTDGDIAPSNSGGGTNHLAVSFNVKAHA